MDIPVVVLSQLPRVVDEREDDNRPILSDLNKYGSLEDHADVICFLYRSAYYDWSSKDEGSSEIIIEKNRNKSLKTIPLKFDREFARFSMIEDNS